MKPRSAKAKGTKLEKEIASYVDHLPGWSARRQPGSGIYQDFPHDVFVAGPEGQEYIVECKAWKNGWRTGDKAMGAADILVIKRNHGTPCVYMPWATFEALAHAQSALLERLEEQERALQQRIQAAGEVA